jgi:hypothetical protein
MNRQPDREDICMKQQETLREPGRDVPIAAEADIIVVGGGPAGLSAAVAAARQGADTLLVERYPYLGGLASGGMVLVLDDMHNGTEISVRGIAIEIIERMQRHGLAVVPPPEDRVEPMRSTQAAWDRWARWGTFDFHTHSKPHPVVYAAAFDPDGFKRAAYEMVGDAGVRLQLHSWFSNTLVEDGRAAGIVVGTKEGRQALRARVVIDTTGDLDVAASAGAPFITSSYILTTVSRLGGVDTEAAEAFEREEPEAFAEIDREAKRIIGGSWDFWWLKTPLPGIVWCNCPHMPGLDGLSVADLTKAEIEGRARMYRLVDYARAHLPGFERCFVVDFAPQPGVRQTRMLEGQYVVTKEDVVKRRHFMDTVARGRDYYTPYRALLPRGVDQMLVAGRHYSATPQAQKVSREIPPCMAMGEAAGVAAAVALESGTTVADVDVGEVQKRLRAAGADPGDVPSTNALIAEVAA